MPQFDRKSTERISKTVRREERRLRSQRAQRARYTDKRQKLVMFELLEPLTQWSGDVVQAARKNWDPTADSGAGGFVVDCTDIIYVADFNQVGHNAGVGGFGAAQMYARQDSTWVGCIVDLCCPGDEKGTCP